MTLNSSSGPEYTAALFRHFADLRDGTHGGASSRRDKERLYVAAVALLDPYCPARAGRDEHRSHARHRRGCATGVRPSAAGGLEAVWALSWPEQHAASIKPILIRAYFGLEFLHPASAERHRR